jgi:glycosyltransferase involved in cell wall biosynthesis
VGDLRTLSVVIPAYNEEDTIAEVVDRVANAEIGDLDLEILVVDDGSRDGTRAVVEALPGVVLLTHSVNGGKGKAVKTGFAAATGDIVLIQDGDLEYDPQDYKAVLQPLLTGEAEAVMGTRFGMSRPRYLFGKRRSPFFTHYIGNITIIWLTNLLYGHSATDYEGGTKAFLKPVVDSVPVEADGFEFDNELICKMLRRGHRIVEVPITYEPRTYADGKKITWRHGVRMLFTIVKWRFARF